MFSKITADSSTFSKDRADFSQRNEIEWMRHKLILILQVCRTAQAPLPLVVPCLSALATAESTRWASFPEARSLPTVGRNIFTSLYRELNVARTILQRRRSMLLTIILSSAIVNVLPLVPISS